MQHIVIIGNGIAGITAARNIRKLSDHKITVISGETDHFFSRTALMYIYMGHMKYEHTKPYEDWFWDKNKIELKKEWVDAVDFDTKNLKFKSGEKMSYDKLILALGSKPNSLKIQGDNLIGVQSLYSFQDLEKMNKSTQDVKHAVIVGGGLIGVEMAEMLHSRNIKVTYLIREKHFWNIALPDEEAKLIDIHLTQDHHIDLLSEAEIKAIKDDGSGRVSAVVTKSGKEIPCQFVGITIGVSPNIDLIANTKLHTNRGITVDENLQTNITDVYAIGDCAELKTPLKHRRAIEPVWYTGRMMGETVAHTITGNKTKYLPGVWFNSAKFFDIEYQTYGSIKPVIEKNEADFYWQNSTKKQALRLRYDRINRNLIGVNSLGIRLRHEVIDRWIKNEQSIEESLSQLPDAVFDSEFSKPFVQSVIDLHNKQSGSNLRLKQKLWSRITGMVKA